MAKPFEFSIKRRARKKAAAATVKGFDEGGGKRLIRVDWRDLDVQQGFNPRQHFDAEKIDELARVIAERGEIPGVITAAIVKEGSSGRLLLRDGERRLRAADLAVTKYGAPKDMKAQILIESDKISPPDSLIAAMQTNKGEPLHPIEEGKAFSLLVDFEKTPDDIASTFGRSAQWVRDRLSLCKLITQAQRAFFRGEINLTEAYALAKRDSAAQKKSLEKILTRLGRKDRKAGQDEDTPPRVTRRRSIPIKDVDNAHHFAKMKAQQASAEELPHWNGIILALSFCAGDGELEGYNSEFDYEEKPESEVTESAPKTAAQKAAATRALVAKADAGKKKSAAKKKSGGKKKSAAKKSGGKKKAAAAKKSGGKKKTAAKGSSSSDDDYGSW